MSSLLVTYRPELVVRALWTGFCWLQGSLPLPQLGRAYFGVLMHPSVANYSGTVGVSSASTMALPLRPSLPSTYVGCPMRTTGRTGSATVAHREDPHEAAASDLGIKVGAWPARISSAAFSAIIMTAAFGLPLTTLGMTEASTMRSPSTP